MTILRWVICHIISYLSVICWRLWRMMSCILRNRSLGRFYQIPWMLYSPAPQLPRRFMVRSTQMTLCPCSAGFSLIRRVSKVGWTFLYCSHVWMREDDRDTESSARGMSIGCLGGLSWLGWLTAWNKLNAISPSSRIPLFLDTISMA